MDFIGSLHEFRCVYGLYPDNILRMQRNFFNAAMDVEIDFFMLLGNKSDDALRMYCSL